MNYNSLMNKPTINYRELIGDNTVTEVGGITEEQFNTLLNTDLSSYYTKTQIDDLFSRSYVYREKSGSIVTFDCPASINGIDKVVSEIVAVQDLHGYDSPWVGGSGKNKLKIDSNESGYGITNSFIYDSDNNIIGIKSEGTSTATSNAFFLIGTFNLSAGNYVLNGGRNGNGGVIAIDVNGTTISFSNTDDMPFTLENESSVKAYIRVSPSVPTTNSVFYPMIRLATVSDATFAPYSNICPFSGWSAVNVYDGPTTDPQDATVYTTALKDENDQPLVCYGGQLSNVNVAQSLVLTHGYIASYNGETLPSTWISDRDVYAEGTTPTIGAEVVYELATPQQISQDSLSIATQEGTNNLWCDSGDITVKALDRIIQG